MIGNRGKSKVYIVAALFLVLFCAIFFVPCSDESSGEKAGD